MKTQQLEIGFAGGSKRTRMYPSQRRRARARWWFAQMRLAVDAATAAQDALPRGPVQTNLALSH